MILIPDMAHADPASSNSLRAACCDRFDVKLIEMVLQAKLEWQQVIDALPYPMVLTDPEGRILRGNLATVSGNMDQVRLLPGRPVSDPVRELGQEILKNGSMERRHLRDCSILLDKGLDTPHYEAAELVSWPIHDDEGEVERLAHYLVDQTALYRLEKQLIDRNRMAAIGMLASGIAHNINGPLQGMIAQLQLLELRMEEEGNEEERVVALGGNDLDSLQELTTRMRGILQSLMQKLRNEHNNEPLPVNLNLLIATELDVLNANMEFKHQVKREIHLDPALDPVTGVYSDLSQGIMNIVYNALDAMHGRDSKLLTIISEHLPEGGNRLRIRDTGCGIPRELQHRIFQPFFTTKAAVGQPGQSVPTGTGLGMSSASHLLGKYGIEIEFSSDVGVGTEFRLFWRGD